MFNCSEGDALKTEVEILLNDEPVVLSVFGLATLFATAHRKGITAEEVLIRVINDKLGTTVDGMQVINDKLGTTVDGAQVMTTEESALVINGDVVEFDAWTITAMRAEAYLVGQTLDSVLEKKIAEFLDNPALLIGAMETATA